MHIKMMHFKCLQISDDYELSFLTLSARKFLVGSFCPVYKPAVQNNTIIADTGSAHKLHSILPKFLPETSLFSLQK